MGDPPTRYNMRTMQIGESYILGIPSLRFVCFSLALYMPILDSEIVVAVCCFLQQSASTLHSPIVHDYQKCNNNGITILLNHSNVAHLYKILVYHHNRSQNH